MAMFNSYVSLPEGIWSLVSIVTQPSTVTGFHDACYDTYEWGMTISVHWQFMQVLIMAHTVITWVIWGFPEMGVPPNGWFISWKIHLQMDDLGVPLFQETSIWIGWKLEQRHVGLWGLASDLSHPTGPILRYQILTYPHSQNHQQTGLWPQSFWHVQHQLRIHSVWGQN